MPIIQDILHIMPMTKTVEIVLYPSIKFIAEP
jgi:hypothetical protein